MESSSNESSVSSDVPDCSKTDFRYYLNNQSVTFNHASKWSAASFDYSYPL